MMDWQVWLSIWEKSQFIFYTINSIKKLIIAEPQRKQKQRRMGRRRKEGSPFRKSGLGKKRKRFLRNRMWLQQMISRSTQLSPTT
jgi:hypothetical protein